MSIPSNPESINIACFISPHGFGHAARAAAVMESLYQKDRSVGFDIYTSVPQWFFEDSLLGPFAYHFLVTDVGLVQETPMQADLNSTVDQLDLMLPFDRTLVHSLAEKVLGNHCRLILCDIAPLGIEKDNIRLLPHYSGVYHPDLVNASDVVIGKLGYSTLAEVFQAGIPFGYIPRIDFRESAVQKAYIEENMCGLDLREAELLEGAWVDRVPDLLAMPKKPPPRINGAEQAAEYILHILD